MHILSDHDCNCPSHQCGRCRRLTLRIVLVLRIAFEAGGTARCSLPVHTTTLTIGLGFTRLAHAVVWTRGLAFGAGWAAGVPIEISTSASAVKLVGAGSIFDTARVVLRISGALEASDAASGSVIARSTATLVIKTGAIAFLGCNLGNGGSDKQFHV